MKITKKHLEGKGSRILFRGETTDKEINLYGWGDENRVLKFVVAKGFIDDWCIYVERMDALEMRYEQVHKMGNKIHNRETIKKLIDCDEVIERYRD